MTPSSPGRRLAVLLHYAMESELKGISRRAHLTRVLGMDYSNLNNALQGNREFTLLQVQMAATYFGFSADGIFGFSDQAFREKSLSHLHISALALKFKSQEKSQEKTPAERPATSNGAV